MKKQNNEPVLSTDIETNRYRSMLNVLPSPIFYADKTLHYRFTNDAYCKWLGLENTALLENKIVEVLGENTFVKLQPYIEAVLAGNRICFELHNHPYFQNETSMECCYIPDIGALGDVKGFLACITDITGKRKDNQKLKKRGDILSDTLDIERTQSTRALSESDKRYNSMISEVEDYAILSIDCAGIIQNWNKGAQKIKGYSDDEIVGKTFKVFYRLEDQQRGLPEQLLDIATREGRATHEGWRVRKDGSRFWGSVLINAVHDETGAVIGFTKVTRDLTERKKGEDQMRCYARELKMQNQELERFAYVASHDLKEPLRKILVYSKRLLSPNSLTNRQLEFVQKIVHSGERMVQLIEDILSYATTTTKYQTFEKVDLTTLVEETVSHFQDDEEHGSMKVTASKLPVIHGIPYQLSLLFINLFSNSIKYRHPDRTLDIKISSIESREEAPGTSEKDKFYKITFSDNGIGFDNQYKEQIFELFQRLFTKDEYEGTGLGLAICRKIMQNHYGFISAKGEPDAGATFELFFPDKYIQLPTGGDI